MAEELLSYMPSQVQDFPMSGLIESHTFDIALHSGRTLRAAASDVAFVTFGEGVR